jgi:hypothetical protein
MFILVELSLAIAFGVLSDKNHYNRAAVIEWIISFIYTFYVWSFAIDFIPAVRTKHYKNKAMELDMVTAVEDEESRPAGYSEEMQETNNAAYMNANASATRINGRSDPVEASRNF